MFSVLNLTLVTGWRMDGRGARLEAEITVAHIWKKQDSRCVNHIKPFFIFFPCLFFISVRQIPKEFESFSVFLVLLDNKF